MMMSEPRRWAGPLARSLRRHAVRAGAACSICSSLLGCSDAAAPRPQVVLQIDTNMPVVEQLVDASVMRMAAVDRLRIEVLDADGGTTDERDFLVPDVASWPVSFGLVGEQDQTVWLRLRAFRTVLAAPGGLSAEVEPDPAVTIERLLVLTLPADTVDRLGVMLHGDCFGTPSSFEAGETCIEDGRLRVSPREGIEEAPGGASAAGTWAWAREIPCGTEQPGVCIPGGFTVLGDRKLEQVDAQGTSPPVPLVAVRLPPFWMDTTEVSVKRYRDSYNEGEVHQAPYGYDATSSVQDECNWHGATEASHDGFPLNCVQIEDAQAACEAWGGTLPTEARWEHAARGHGEGRRYPWGEEPPACCSASIGRPQPCGEGAGPEEIGSHLPSEACPVADLSPEGLIDMAGSVSELVHDRLIAYDDPCWTNDGVALDPFCWQQDVPIAARGAAFRFGPGVTQSAFRFQAFSGVGVADETVGFRCVYEDVP